MILTLLCPVKELKRHLMHYLSCGALVDTEVRCMLAMSDTSRIVPWTPFGVIASKGDQQLRRH
jgi:hypothetical protein